LVGQRQLNCGAHLRVGYLPYSDVASRVAVAKLRLDGTPTPRSWVARMTKRPAPTGAGKSASRSGRSASSSLSHDRVHAGRISQGARLLACHGQRMDVVVAAVWPLRIPKALDAHDQLRPPSS